MLYKPALVYTKELNRLIKRVGGVLTQQAYAMRIYANLPKDLLHKMYQTTAYILNYTPTKALGQKILYKIVQRRKLLISYIRPISCRVYVYNYKLKVANKLKLRVIISYLVRY